MQKLVRSLCIGRALILASFAILVVPVARACPDGTLEADQTLSVRGLSSVELISAVPGREFSLQTCVNLGEDTFGYVNAAPSLVLEVGDQFDGWFFAGARSNCDTNLLVQKPDGDFVFDDDSGSSRQPMLPLDGTPGWYRIWLGQYDADLDCAASIALTPAASRCPDPGEGISIPINLTPGQTEISTGLTATAGGPLDLRGCEIVAEELGLDVSGFAPAQPQFSFQVADLSDAALNLQVPGLCDTALLVRDQAGNWYFDDDSYGDFAPRLTLPSAGITAFDVWISVYNNEACEVDLEVGQAVVQEPVSEFCPAVGNAADTRLLLDSNVVEESFDILYGSSTDILSCEGTYMTASPRGYFDAAPQLKLVVEDEGPDFIGVEVEGGCDGVMLVSTPYGTWGFNDDQIGINPGLQLNLVLPGTYAVWVGTYESEQNCSGQLHVTTIAPACPSVDLAPKETYAYTGADLIGSQTHAVIAGGDTNTVACPRVGDLASFDGYFADRPDFAFDLSEVEDLSQVRILGDATCDTVLLVQDASGQWHYNDDGDSERGASRVSMPAVSGRYSVWIGTYLADLCEGRVSIDRGLTKE